MAKKTQPASRRQIMFVDGLRGYRLADALRNRHPRMEVRVWHDHAQVVVEFPDAWAAEPETAEILELAGGMATSGSPGPARPLTAGRR